MQKKIAILGGGLSGLSSSLLMLQKFPNISLHLYEKTNSIGGAISSHQLENSDGSWLETGPSSIRKSFQINEIMKIIEETNLLSKIIPSKEYPQVYLYSKEKMRVFPRNFWPSTLMNFAADNRSFLSSFFKPTFTKTKTNKTNLSDCSVKELIDNRTRIGFLELNELKQHLYEILGAIFNGVYSSDISELSSKICLYKIHHEQYYAKYCNNQEYKKYEPKVKALVKNYLHSSSSFTFEKGLNTLPKGILNYLHEKYPQNFQIHWNEEVRSLDLNSQSMIKLNDNEIYDMVISALPLPNIRNILAKDSIFKESKPYQILESVRLKSVARINFYFDKEVLPKELQSFGFLNYPNEKEEALGMTFDSRVFPLNKNETRCSIMIGNDMVEKYEFDEKKLMNVAEKYLQKRLNIKEKANEIKISIWKKFMPIFDVGHFDKMTKLFSELEATNRNFKITGNFIFSPAIPEIVLLNKCLVENIARSHKF